MQAAAKVAESLLSFIDFSPRLLMKFTGYNLPRDQPSTPRDHAQCMTLHSWQAFLYCAARGIDIAPRGKNLAALPVS
jgi:hypothetical protein